MSVERGTEPAAPRQSRVERNTRETRIVLTLNLDGTGASKVETGIPFFDHMLEAWSKHALMDLHVDAKGDLDVDLHHTVEDVGICLGKALREAVGDKKGIVRYGASFLPMDEALLHAAVDLSGRPYLVFNVPLQRTRIGSFDLDLLKDFFRAVAVNALVIGQIFFLLNSRYKLDSSLSVKAHLGNKYLGMGIGAVVVLQLLFTYAPPLQALFETEAIPLWVWPWLFLGGLLVFLVIEAEKLAIRTLGPAGLARDRAEAAA